VVRKPPFGSYPIPTRESNRSAASRARRRRRLLTYLPAPMLPVEKSVDAGRRPPHGGARQGTQHPPAPRVPPPPRRNRSHRRRGRPTLSPSGPPVVRFSPNGPHRVGTAPHRMNFVRGAMQFQRQQQHPRTGRVPTASSRRLQWVTASNASAASDFKSRLSLSKRRLLGADRQPPVEEWPQQRVVGPISAID
jgi:hypothetical protein